MVLLSMGFPNLCSGHRPRIPVVTARSTSSLPPPSPSPPPWGGGGYRLLLHPAPPPSLVRCQRASTPTSLHPGNRRPASHPFLAGSASTLDLPAGSTAPPTLSILGPPPPPRDGPPLVQTSTPPTNLSASLAPRARGLSLFLSRGNMEDKGERWRAS
ncbi:hypothetical protein E2562_034728 [Oryza meyeriana var. granulata]|uniref:Uncharacterized protein n=1 Tax=Oryza meyeriana var. granulata TaxID=110450 RepID=A0A6G1CAS8_9ORYZ|nr:hypothetical protein E2562_034728 [Oryza meyeriana var. granulata]